MKEEENTTRVCARVREQPASTDFDQFWLAYPKKKSKGQALKAWNKLNGTKPPIKTILTAIAAQRAGHDWQKDGGQFIPHPATWLLGSEALDPFRATYLNNMGMTLPSGQNALGNVPSYETFLTNWNRMSPETKAIMGYSVPEVEGLANIAASQRVLKGAGNPSRTATIMDALKQSVMPTIGAAVGAGTHGATGFGLGAAGGVALDAVPPIWRRIGAGVLTDPAATEWLLRRTPASIPGFTAPGGFFGMGFPQLPTQPTSNFAQALWNYRGY